MLCTLNTLVAESEANSASTSAPWKVTINNAYFICISLPPAPPGRTSSVEPSGPQKKEGGNRTHFRPTFLPRGINTEFKNYVVCCNLFLALLYPSQPTRAHVVPRFSLSHLTFRWRKKGSNCKVRTVQQPTNN